MKGLSVHGTPRYATVPPTATDRPPDRTAWLQSVVRGYFGYHALPGNWKALAGFRTQCTRLWYRVLRRRSQKSRLTWDRMTKIADAWLPPARILHPWPEQRLAALIQGKSRMQ
jgi:hypothetical protein